MKQIASARISRPSASVFVISIDFPAMLITTSPGLIAVPLGMFSTVGMMPVTRSGSSSSDAARNAPRTAAAPDMSYFMRSMSSRGLRLIPPVSKVTPLPIKATCGRRRRRPAAAARIGLAAAGAARAR